MFKYVTTVCVCMIDLLVVLHDGQDGVDGAEDAQGHDGLVLVLLILLTLKDPGEDLRLPNTHTYIHTHTLQENIKLYLVQQQAKTSRHRDRNTEHLQVSVSQMKTI